MIFNTISDNAQSFKALGDETRLKMIGLLSHGELCVCDLMEVLELPQSTTSRHLAYLKNSLWVVGRRKGKWMYYKLNPDLDRSQFHCSLIEFIAKLNDFQQDYARLLNYLERKDQTVCS
jgi:ArsR family transcriptional regulator